MEQKVREFAEAKTKELMEAFSCYQGAKEKAQAFLDALGTEGEQKAAREYIAELEADIMPIDTLIAFAGSEGGAKVFGPEKTKEVEAHAKKIKAAGARYCDCPACAACEAILSKKAEILA